MNCNEANELIHGYFDGELDLVRSLAVEQHLKDCPACAQAHRERQALRAAITAGAPYFDAPKGLGTRVRSALRQASGEGLRGGPRTRRWGWDWNWPSFLAPVATAALVLLIALPMITHRATEDRLAEEIVSAHVRSLMVDHKTDVTSSDQHTVKPWFDGKLDFAPPVVDLAEHGFPLAGGRLDYVQGRPVAALVYQRHKHFINLFIWPAPGSSERAEKMAVRQGYNLIRWNASGMSFWAASDLNRAELGEFARFFK
jgi:anti-sigma factor RsiW